MNAHPERLKWVKKTLFICYIGVTGCVTQTYPHNQHASALPTVPLLPSVPTMNKRQQDSQCTEKLLIRHVRVTAVVVENQ